MPIPAFLIYDGFHQDLDAIVIYERFASHEDFKTVFPRLSTILIAYLKGVMVKTNKDVNTVRLNEPVFSEIPSDLAKKWKTTRFKQIFPTVNNQQQTTPTTNHTTASDIAAIMALVQAQAKIATPTITTPADIEAETKLGLSNTAFAKLLTMCGVPLSCADKSPELWTKLAEKGTSKSDRESTVRAALSTQV